MLPPMVNSLVLASISRAASIGLSVRISSRRTPIAQYSASASSSSWRIQGLWSRSATMDRTLQSMCSPGGLYITPLSSSSTQRQAESDLGEYPEKNFVGISTDGSLEEKIVARARTSSIVPDVPLVEPEPRRQLSSEARSTDMGFRLPAITCKPERESMICREMIPTSYNERSTAVSAQRAQRKNGIGYWPCAQAINIKRTANMSTCCMFKARCLTEAHRESCCVGQRVGESHRTLASLASPPPHQ